MKTSSKITVNENASAAKRQGANNAVATKDSKKGGRKTSAKSQASPKGEEPMASKEASPEVRMNLAIAKFDKAIEVVAASKEAVKTAQDSLKAAQFKAEALNQQRINIKHSLGQGLTVEDKVLYDCHRLSVYANQSGLDKAYSLVADKLASLRDELATAKAEAKSLNAAIRNLLADWDKFEPIFKSVGLAKADVKASLLSEASPFLCLPTGEGIKVAALTRRVKRDSQGYPLKVDGKKVREACLKAITVWDPMTFATTAIAVVLTKGAFSAEAETKHRQFLEEAEQSLKALAEAKAAAKAAKQAEREAKAAAKAAEVAEEKASKEAIAKQTEDASKEAINKSRSAAKAALHTIAKVDAKASDGAAKVKAATKGSKKGSRKSTAKAVA